MMVSNRGSVLRLLAWQWRNVAFFFLAAAITYWIHDVFGVQWWRLPLAPITIAGSALGIFVSFRTNSAYDRWWEGRRLWGQLVNGSRVFVSQVMAYLPAGEGGAPSPLQRALVQRHVAYIHWLRCALRDQDGHEDAAVRRALPDAEADGLRGESNPPHALLHAQLRDLCAAAERGELGEMRLGSLDRTVAALLDAQGGCERIKRTPMPRGYGFIAERLTLIFGCLLPLGLVADIDGGVMPINVLVCLSFALIGEAGRVLEDPFTMYWNGLPLGSISTTIEINLRSRLGDRDLPRPVAVDENGILL